MEMAVLSVFLSEKGLRPLGIKVGKYLFLHDQRLYII